MKKKFLYTIVITLILFSCGYKIVDNKINFKILDVNIDGVSMLVTQRAEFMSVIKNHPDGVVGLIKAMKKKILI